MIKLDLELIDFVAFVAIIGWVIVIVLVALLIKADAEQTVPVCEEEVSLIDPCYMCLSQLTIMQDTLNAVSEVKSEISKMYYCSMLEHRQEEGCR